MLALTLAESGIVTDDNRPDGCSDPVLGGVVGGGVVGVGLVAVCGELMAVLSPSVVLGVIGVVEAPLFVVSLLLPHIALGSYDTFTLPLLYQSINDLGTVAITNLLARGSAR